MHPTTHTHISDTLTKLRRLDSKLEQASFMPIEELVGLLVAGSLIVNQLSELTVKAQFTEHEVAFIELLITRINTELEGIYADNEAMEQWNTPEDWDSSSDDDCRNEGWEYPEWDN